MTANPRQLTHSFGTHRQGTLVPHRHQLWLQHSKAQRSAPCNDPATESSVLPAAMQWGYAPMPPRTDRPVHAAPALSGYTTLLQPFNSSADTSATGHGTLAPPSYTSRLCCCKRKLAKSAATPVAIALCDDPATERSFLPAAHNGALLPYLPEPTDPRIQLLPLVGTGPYSSLLTAAQTQVPKGLAPW